MAGLFILELDTMAPEIVIYAPNYTTKTAEVEITVMCDEKLSDGYQNFYVLDQYGKKHQYTFSYEENQFVGKVVFSDYDNGIVTFYAQVKDEVDNLSILASKTIRIIPSSNYLRLEIIDSIHKREMVLSSVISIMDSSIIKMGNNISIFTEIRETNVSTGDRDINIDIETRSIEIKTEVVEN